MRLGINVVSVDESTNQLEKLKKLERFLAQQDGVNVASSVDSGPARDSEAHAERVAKTRTRRRMRCDLPLGQDQDQDHDLPLGRRCPATILDDED